MKPWLLFQSGIALVGARQTHLHWTLCPALAREVAEDAGPGRHGAPLVVVPKYLPLDVCVQCEEWRKTRHSPEIPSSTRLSITFAAIEHAGTTMFTNGLAIASVDTSVTPAAVILAHCDVECARDSTVEVDAGEGTTLALVPKVAVKKRHCPSCWTKNRTQLWRDQRRAGAAPLPRGSIEVDVPPLVRESEMVEVEFIAATTAQIWNQQDTGCSADELPYWRATEVVKTACLPGTSIKRFAIGLILGIQRATDGRHSQHSPSESTGAV